MTVTGPASVPELTPFDLQLTWNTPGMMAGDRYYGAFSLGTDAGNAGNIATIPVTITRFDDAVVKVANVNSALPGETVTYTLTVLPNITGVDLNYTLTDTIPAGLTYVPGSATASNGAVSVTGDTLTWSGLMQGSWYYEVATSDTDPNCTMPLATNGAYVDLNYYGLNTNPAFVGDSQWWSTTATVSSFEFFGRRCWKCDQLHG